MYVIIPCSDLDIKETYPVKGIPILEYILKELYSYHETIKSIIIVKKDTTDMKSYLLQCNMEYLFKEKIFVIETTNYKNNTNSLYSIVDDIYCGLEFITDKLKTPYDSVLIWKGNILLQNTKQFIDFTLGDFQCIDKRTLDELNVYRFSFFEMLVNISVQMRNDNQNYSINDFVSSYKKYRKIDKISDFNYIDITNAEILKEINSLSIEPVSYRELIVEKDEDTQTVLKRDSYDELPYTYENNALSENAQYNLWSENEFLNSMNDSQALFVPRVIESAENDSGFFLQYIREELITIPSLTDLILEKSVPYTKWETIIPKICTVLKDIFHNDGIEPSIDYYDSLLSNTQIEEYKDKLSYTSKTIISSLEELVSSNASYFREKNNITKHDINQWKILFEIFIEKTKSYFNQSTVFGNLMCERAVHGNTTFDNIHYDIKYNKLMFNNPRQRKQDIVDSYLDFAYIYMSCITKIDCLLNNAYYLSDNRLMIPNELEIQYAYILKQLDYFFTSDTLFLKLYACLLGFNYIFVHHELKEDEKQRIIKMLNQERENLFGKILE